MAPEEFYSGAHPLDLVTTRNREVPNGINAVPLTAMRPGRGSLVFFNNASFFYWMLTGRKFLKEFAVTPALDVQQMANEVLGRSC